MGFLAVALLVGSNGGLHWDASLLGATLIRSWGRISVVIATLALLVLGMALSHVSVDAISRRMSRSFGHSWVTASIAALALGAVMIWDQSPSRVVDASRIAEFTRSKAFYQQLERALPAGTAVFQLPVVPFPEHWLGSLLYNPLEGVFYTKTLKFSGGGIAGRQADWQENLVAQPEELFAELHDAGFGAVVVDRRGFGDPQWFIDQYEAVPNSRLLFEDADRIALDITEVRAPLDRPGYDLVHQPTIMFGEGLNRSTDGFAAWSSDSDGPLQSTTDSGRVEFHNRTAKPYRACVNFRLKATTAPDGSTTRHITLTTPHHSNDQAVDLGAGASADFAVSVVLPPGITTWTLRAKGGPELDASRRRSAAAMFGVSMSGSFGTAPTCSQAE